LKYCRRERERERPIILQIQFLHFGLIKMNQNGMVGGCFIGAELLGIRLDAYRHLGKKKEIE
jgi:hypothetical protein